VRDRRLVMVLTIASAIIIASGGNLFGLGVEQGNWQMIIMSAVISVCAFTIYWVVYFPQILYRFDRARRRSVRPPRPESDPGSPSGDQ
jgi:hypothetical protein